MRVSLRVRFGVGAVEHRVMQLDEQLQSQVCVCELVCACVSLCVHVGVGAVEHHVMQLDEQLQSQVCVCECVCVS